MEKIIFKQILNKNPLTYDEENAKDFYFTIPTANFTYSSNVHKIQYNNQDFVLGTNLFTIINNNSTNEYQAFTVEGQKLGMILKCMNARDNFLIYEEESKIYFSVYSPYANPCYLTLNYKYLPNTENFTLNDVLEKARVAYEEKTSVYTVGMWRYDNAIFCPMQLNNSTLESPNWSSESEGCFEIANGRLRYFSSWYKLITGKFYKEDELFKMTLNDGRKFVFTKITDFGDVNSCILTANSESEEVKAEPSYAVKDLIYGTDLSYYCPNVNSRLILENDIEFSFENKNSNLVVNVSRTYKGKYNKISFLVTNGIFGGQYISFVDNGNDNFSYGRVKARTNLGFNLAISPFYNDVPFENFEKFLSEQNFSSKEWGQNLARVITLVATNNMTAPDEIREKYGYYTGETGDARNTFSFIGLSNFSESTYVSGGSNSLTDSTISCNMKSAEDWIGFVEFSDGPKPKPPGPGPEPEPVKEDEGITIGTLAELAIQNGVPFLGYQEKLQPFTFMQEYLQDFELFDEDIKETRGFFFPLTVKETKDATLDHFRKRAEFVIKKHAKELEGLWKIAATTFDPAYNVEEHIVEELKKTGSDTLRDAIDAVNQTDSLGARKNTSNYGAQTSTQNTGAQSSSVEYGARQSASQEGKAGFNSSDYQKNVSTNQTENAHTDSTNNGAREDSSTFSAHTDEMTSDAVIDTHKTDFREDVHEQTYNNTISKKYDRKGNVGTMSTPELLQKASDSVEVFDFYDKLYDMVLRELAWYYESI